MTGSVAHMAALQLIKDIAEGSTTANSLQHIAKIAAAALGGMTEKASGASGGAPS